MKRIGLATILIMVAFTIRLVWAQCGSCGACQEKADPKCSISTSNYSDISFTTIKGDTYNLTNVIGKVSTLIYRMRIDKGFDSQVALVKKTRTTTPESSMVFIGFISDVNSKALSRTKKLKLNFPVLLDPDNQLITKFGLSEKSPTLIFINQNGDVVKTTSEVNKEVLAQGIAAATAPAKAVDPVCGMSVNKRTAAGTSEYRGTPYYFCSDACKKLFEGTPSKYLNK